MAYNSVKNYSLIAVTMILLCLVTGYFLVNTYYPNLQQANDAKLRSEQTNADLKQALASEKTFLKTFESQQKNVELANLILPTGSTDMANFVNNLSNLAQASGVSLANFAVNDSQNSDKTPAVNAIQAQDLGFSASGTYLSLKNFLTSLENTSRLMDISKIVLASQDKTNTNNPNLQYQVKLHTYFQQ